MKLLSFESLEQRRLMAVGPLMLEPVGSGFISPVVATHAGDGSGRLFVAEQGGLVHIVRGGERDEQPFLDIRSELADGGASGERGLLGLAFHPDFANAGSAGQGLFYVYYSAPPANGGNHDSVVAEFRVSNSDPDAADVESQRMILRFSQPFGNHNGGDLKFGPDDGFLYISSGDGGSGGDPQGNGQNGQTLLGAILRIDVGGDDFPSDASRNYSIPAANPFAGDQSVRDEIFALGLRNPFRMSFDDGPGGRASPDRLFVGDVGQSTFEEVDIVTSGGNYGWNVCEGDHVFNRANLSCPSQFIPPIAEYGRNVGISVIGGFVYRGSLIPQLDGVYLFGDLNGTLMALEEQPDGSFVRSNPTIDGRAAENIIGFGEDESGELYVLTFTEVLSMGAPQSDPVVNASGDVRVAVDGSEIVVSDQVEELFRSPIDSLNSLSLQLSADVDRVTLVASVSLLPSFLRIDGGDGDDSLVLSGSAQVLDLTTLPQSQLVSIEAIDVSGNGANTLTLSSGDVVRLSGTTQTLRISHDENDLIDYGAGWTVSQPALIEGQFVHRLAQDVVSVEITNTRQYQNPLVAHDANRDGDVTALDALRIVNALDTRRGPLDVSAELDEPFVYFDVSGDESLSALDALRVINEVARREIAPALVETEKLSLLPADVDSLFLWISRRAGLERDSVSIGHF